MSRVGCSRTCSLIEGSLALFVLPLKPGLCGGALSQVPTDVAMSHTAFCTTHVMALATSPAVPPLRLIFAIRIILITHYYIIVTISKKGKWWRRNQALILGQMQSRPDPDLPPRSSQPGAYGDRPRSPFRPPGCRSTACARQGRGSRRRETAPLPHSRRLAAHAGPPRVTVP